MDIDTKRVSKKILLDFFCLLAVGLPVLFLRLFGKPFKRGFFCNDETIRYPFHTSTVPDFALYIVGLGLPILVMSSIEVSLSRKGTNRPAIFLYGWELPHSAFRIYKVVGVFCFGALCSQLTTDIGKYSIGRLRPHFFDVCQPDIDCSNAAYHYKYIDYDQYTCLNTNAKLLREARLSFPSGHSSISAYTMVYFALYLQSRMNWRGSLLFKHFLQFCCISLSWATALSRVTDNKHHWSDVLVGLIIGTTVAFLIANYVSDLFKPANSQKNVYCSEVLSLNARTPSD